MSDYIILTDSTCDLPQEIADKYDLRLVYLKVLIGDKEYRNYLDGRELSYHDFYQSMRDKNLPTTSAVNVAEFLEVMEPELQAGRDILYIAFSSPLSGTYNAGCVAAEELLEKYPERKIIAVDTLCATTGEGLLVEMCAMEKEKGKTIEEVAKFAEEHKMNMRHMFTVEDLFHLVRGGPLLTVNRDGYVDAYGKARGRKKALKMLVDDVRDNIIDKDLPFYVSHGDNEEGAKELADMIREEIGCTDIRISYLGCVCGSHGGPDLVGVFYYGKER